MKNILNTLGEGNPDTGPVDIAPDKKPTMFDMEDVRQVNRLPPGYKFHDPANYSFDPRLAYELALGLESPQEVFDRYGYSTDDAVKLLSNKTFIKTIKDYKLEVQENGITFKLKARIQAEDLLSHSYQIATDTSMPANVRADMIKWTTAVAELGPKRDHSGGGGGSALTLAITFAGGAPETKLVVSNPEREVIEHEQ